LELSVILYQSQVTMSQNSNVPLEERLRKLEEVVASFERFLKHDEKNKQEQAIGHCHMPVVQERQLDPGISNERLSLIRYYEKK